MIFEHQSKNKNILLGMVIVFLLGGTSYITWSKFSSLSEPVYCTQETKLCPDGSHVGRTGLQCEFAPCPQPSPEDTVDEAGENWKTTKDSKTGVTFQYPETLLTEYIHTQDWPPQIQVLNETFTCTEAGVETARAGQTLKRTVDNRTYCVTKVTEGAAGSIYNQYAYAFQADIPPTPEASARQSMTVIFTFSLRTVQCGNYNEAERKACEGEHETFDLDDVVDRMAMTLQFTQQTTPPAVSTSGGINGTVLLGPTCPVVMDPPDPACADKPYATNLVLTTADQSRVITEFSSDANGKFSVKVQPGEYTIRSAATANILPYCSHDQFKVEANKFTNITISCDTGIR